VEKEIVQRTKEDRERAMDFLSKELKSFFEFSEKEIPGNLVDVAQDRVQLLSELVCNFVCNIVWTFSNEAHEASFPSNMLEILGQITSTAAHANSNTNCNRGDCH